MLQKFKSKFFLCFSTNSLSAKNPFVLLSCYQKFIFTKMCIILFCVLIENTKITN